MRALTFDEREESWSSSRGMVLRDVPRPVLDPQRDPKDAERVIAKVKLAGFCGTDRGLWARKALGDMVEGSMKSRGEPVRIFGHECLAEIVEMGPAIAASGKFKIGEMVTAESHLVCGRCHQCLGGQHHVCANEQILGVSVNGCFADYVKLPADALWKIDLDKIRPEIASIQEPFGNAVHACQSTDLRGKRVAIFGTGTIGMFAILVARGMGASRVFGIDPNPAQRELALKLGCDAVFDPRRAPKDTPWAHDPNIVTAIKDQTYGIGADVCLEMAGYPDSVNNAIQCARRGGEIVLFGVRDGNVVIENCQHVIMNGLKLQGIVGRQLWNTWIVGRSLLEDPTNGIQDAIWEHILDQGRGPIVSMKNWDVPAFEEALTKWPKLVLNFDD